MSEIRHPRPQFAGHHGQKGRAARLFSHILAVCVHHRWITIAVTVAASALSLFGMNFVQQQFFPSSDHAELAIDWNDEVFAGAVLTHDGQIKHEATRKAMEGQST